VLDSLNVDICNRELSSVLGRPDSLGFDQFHTQRLPTEIRVTSHAPDLLEIVSHKVDLAKLRRLAMVHLYAPQQTTAQMLLMQKSLHDRVIQWRSSIPTYLIWRNENEPSRGRGRRARRVPHWKTDSIQKQSLVLELGMSSLARTLSHVTDLLCGFP
jgi:hypothetical protein